MPEVGVASAPRHRETGTARRLDRVLVANRGEIAVRVITACQALGIETVAVVSTVDRHSEAARLADRSICIGPGPAGKSYLDVPSVLQAAIGTGCDGIHPGYGFLSENPDFARRCEEEGLVFVGPRPEVVAEAGDKARAREVARAAGIPVLEGSPILDDAAKAVEAAEAIGFPVLIKAAAGGGGRGMVVIEDAAQMAARFTSAAAESAAAFGDGRVYVERYVRRARHLEVQVLGDRHGTVVHVGERDCSAQRRHQKVIEESPAPNLPEEIRQSIRDAGRRFAETIGLDSAGTVEFVYDADRGDFAFLEFNARIQVEHPVSEMVSGIDLVQAQLRSARGEPLGITQNDVRLSGHAIEVRITTESPRDGFLPRTGRLDRWKVPTGEGIRVDTHAVPGLVVGPYYDSLLAKVVAHGDTREQAIDRLRRALRDLEVEGVPTTADFAEFALGTDDMSHGEVTTTWIADTGLPAYEAARPRPQEDPS